MNFPPDQYTIFKRSSYSSKADPYQGLIPWQFSLDIGDNPYLYLRRKPNFWTTYFDYSDVIVSDSLRM